MLLGQEWANPEYVSTKLEGKVQRGYFHKQKEERQTQAKHFKDQTPAPQRRKGSKAKRLKIFDRVNVAYKAII